MALSNSEIADRLTSLAQLLAAQKENPFKIKAYRRAARTIKTLADSVEELVRSESDLTAYAGIGKGISGAIREIVLSGTMQQLETLRSQVSPEVAAISEHPALDPARVLRIYKKLHISSIDELKKTLESGELAASMGARTAQHVRQALIERHEMLLYQADPVARAVGEFLIGKCGVRRAVAAGDYRRRVEVLSELVFVIETDNFPTVVERLQRMAGRTEKVRSTAASASFILASGIILRVDVASTKNWGVTLIACTGSAQHLLELDLASLAASGESFSTEAAAYQKLGLSFIEPELREGRGEVQLAREGKLPRLVSRENIRGELHAHSTSSDGSDTIEEMAAGAKERGYEYIGITDHSQSLKIARGLTEADLWEQIRYIDAFNEKSDGIRVLKSAEVDILADGSLDYPDALLAELDYTVCSVHSRFNLDRAAQTERILRAMDNRYFTMLGHATGRLLLKRPGYEIDVERVIEHARKNGCFFEINSSPDRLDLSADNARLARDAGVKIAINTDSHSAGEMDLIVYGIGQARRAGLDTESVLNCRSWPELQRLFRR